MESPPKRVTRARAAAKSDTGSGGGVQTTRIATAASKAKASRSLAVNTTKRKTRADDTLEDEQEQDATENIIEPEQPPKATRGRSKKAAVDAQHDPEIEIGLPVKTTRGRAAQPEPEQEMNAPPKKAHRGRAVKCAEPELEMGNAPAPAKTTRGRANKSVVEVPASEQIKVSRGRAKKIDPPSEDALVEEIPKRATRARAGTLPKTPAIAPKKSVKFEEPDKENIVPTSTKMVGKPKVTEVGTGLRAKPVRKPAASATRTTRGRGKVALPDASKSSSPLSPKKITQVGAKEKETVSDDELAAPEKTPMKPLMKSPVKPAGSIFCMAKKLDYTDSNTITVNQVTTQDLSGSVMASPARRPPQSPLKESLKTSPQRLTFANSMLQSPFKPSLAATKTVPQNTASKALFLQSPARRPASPTKVSEEGSPTRDIKASIFGTTPKAHTFKISRFATPRTLNKNVSRPGLMMPPSAPPKLSTGYLKPAADTDDDSTMTSQPTLKFSGRLSSIMPRETDPAFVAVDPILEEAKELALAPEQATMGMNTDQAETVIVEDPMDTETTNPSASPPRNILGLYSLRDEDESPFHDSDSEDELASSPPKFPPTPIAPFNVSSHSFASSPVTFNPISTPGTTKSQRPSLETRSEKIGFTPLATQLTNWMAVNPEKFEETLTVEIPLSPTSASFEKVISADTRDQIELSPAKSTFFDDEMSIRDDIAAVPRSGTPAIEPIEIEFDPVVLDDEDFALAEEADEMSMLEPEQLQFNDQNTNLFQNDELHIDPELLQMAEAELLLPQEDEAIELQQPEVVHEFENAPSEASQEYGDENAIDPTHLAMQATQTPVTSKYTTPKRVLKERTFHTVSKVPLKAAAEDSPMQLSVKKRSASISRLPIQRPSSNLSRSNTVISYSPTKKTPRPSSRQQSRDFEIEGPMATPVKSEWSTAATPARTPRRDLNTLLLKGATVFVDVHTTEGADAGVLFIELLTEMGARCVKAWTWGGNGDDGSKIGITHVVFKDGGKRTLEKVREANGVVSCVGVGWVLDCERENKWLEEGPYTVDTALVPRGGHRRRKSMEPRALANLNGTLVSSSATPRKSSAEMLNMPACTPMTSKSRRRDSVQWVRSPASSSDINDDQTLLLSPVPQTPAPEMISAYGEEGLYGDETPVGQTPYFTNKEQLVQQTAPVKRYFEKDDEDEGGKKRAVGGMGWLTEKKDESVMMRLMAARRKSLQWAPKVGSPLARG